MVDLFLPDHFAERMFELEAALEYEGSLQIIRDLNDLYRAGIDYYIEREPRKATHLQKKITSLLASPDNIRILQREAKKNNSKGSPLSEKEPEPSPSPTAGMPSLNTRKLKEELSKFHTVADTCIQSIVENSNKMADKMEKLRRRDINKQEEQLNDRIMLKRVRSQEKIMKIRSQTELPLATDEPGDGALSLRRMIQ